MMMLYKQVQAYLAHNETFGCSNTSSILSTGRYLGRRAAAKT